VLVEHHHDLVTLLPQAVEKKLAEERAKQAREAAVAQKEAEEAAAAAEAAATAAKVEEERAAAAAAAAKKAEIAEATAKAEADERKWKLMQQQMDDAAETAAKREAEKKAEEEQRVGSRACEYCPSGCVDHSVPASLLASMNFVVLPRDEEATRGGSPEGGSQGFRTQGEGGGGSGGGGGW
jgi:ParB-like chromosome segregation protein Spo0J